MAGIEHWTPLKDTHAIQSCQLSVHFGEAVGEVLWKRAESQAWKQAVDLGFGERQPLNGLPFPIQLPFQLPPEVVGDQGFIFARRDDSGATTDQLTITRQGLTYEQFVYTRWAPFRQRAHKLMAEVVEAYAAVSSLAAIASGYTDVFVSGGSDEARVQDIVHPDGPFVASGALRDDALWHTHSGFFEHPDAFTRRLIQVNIDIGGAPPRNRPANVQIGTRIADQFGQPEMTALMPEQVSWGFMLQHADEQHLRLKELLRQVLTDPAAHSISLT